MAARFLRLLLIAPVICLEASLSGCSSLFFFPDRSQYLTPDRLNLDYRDLYLESVDGEKLHAWWLPAQGEADGTVYFLHGNAGNISSHIFAVDWLPAEGYNVLLLDYRGFGKSTGSPDLEGALTDAETGLRWLAAHHGDQPIVMIGQSLGGGLAMPLAQQWGERNEQPALAGLVLDSTFTGFRRIAREKLSDLWLTWPLQVPLSWTIPDEYEGIDRIAAISPVPLLIFHSVRDGVVPYHHGTELFTAASEPKQFQQTDLPHGSTFVLPAYRADLLDFLGKVTGTPRTDSADSNHYP